MDFRATFIVFCAVVFLMDLVKNDEFGWLSKSFFRCPDLETVLL